MSIRTFMPALALALVVACGDDGAGESPFGPEGVWRGEASAMRGGGQPIVLCLEIENFQATAPPERFSGALYIDDERHNLVSSTWGPGDELTFSTDERTFTGIVAVERLYGSWHTYGPATGNTGGWTLERTGDGSCE
jgi:hypothetical protein